MIWNHYFTKNIKQNSIYWALLNLFYNFIKNFTKVMYNCIMYNFINKILLIVTFIIIEN